jgi:HAD superfamily hydrolase (TIGR01509 family)
MAEILIVDAMGVLYRAGDDVAELLVPFVRNHGQTGLSAEAIEQEYMAASLGQIDTTTLWKDMGVDPALEDSYLAGHRLIEGTREALPRLQQRFSRITCLSNDVADWSAKLRQLFGLETWIDPWFISGDFGMRKPSPEIYRLAIGRLDVEPRDVVFVDDRLRNLDAAKALGIRTALLDVRGDMPDHPHPRIRRLADLL